MDFIVCHESLLLFRKRKSLSRYNNNIYILKQRFLTKKKKSGILSSYMSYKRYLSHGVRHSDVSVGVLLLFQIYEML